MLLTQQQTKGADFMREIEFLANACQTNIADLFFMHHLVYVQINSKYQKALMGHLGAKIRTATFAELKDEMAFLDGLNLDHLSNSSGSASKTTTFANNSNKNNNNNNVKNNEAKQCGVCGKKNHTTAEHRGPRAGNESKKTDTKTADDRPPLSTITCRKCNAKGHYANSNSCPLFRQPAAPINATQIRSRMAALRVESDRKEGEADEQASEVNVEIIAQALYEMEQRHSTGK
jgi:hypothetical protein